LKNAAAKAIFFAFMFRAFSFAGDLVTRIFENVQNLRKKQKTSGRKKNGCKKKEREKQKKEKTTAYRCMLDLFCVFDFVFFAFAFCFAFSFVLF
jgi:LAS superfamily LD-carboxypeptidase LdcB